MLRVQQMRSRIDRVMPIVKEHLVEGQHAQQQWYDRQAKPCEYLPGDRVLLLTPTGTSKILASWKGPYTVVEKVGPVNCRIHQPGRRREEQLYHLNLLKTAFSTPTGHWQYRLLPFGLPGAPATFQRMMYILLWPQQA
ncbi:MAG: hypothetical protein ACRC9V_15010 [Aeromonas sp.]